MGNSLECYDSLGENPECFEHYGALVEDNLVLPLEKGEIVSKIASGVKSVRIM